VSDPTSAAYEAACDWYAGHNVARATDVVRLTDRAWGLLSPEWPNSFVHNGIVVRDDPGAAQLMAWADDVLGGAGLSHRYVVARCDLAPSTLDSLRESGYEPEACLVMGRATALGPLPRPDGVSVEQVDAAAAGEFEERMWRTEWLPGIADDEVRDLVERRSANDRGGPFLSFVVRDGDEVAASADLAVRGDAAEIDGVATLPSHRGRGYADALVAACLDAAAEAGCSVVYLEALVEDWPRGWYGRRGFTELGPSWNAARRTQ
jgi:GNAT superfamily N-acetyltransferase